MRICILGAGPGGYVAAIKAAQLGASVTVIEDTEVGGTCLNRGCIPTKTLIASAELYAKAKELPKFGIDLSGTVTPNMRAMMERKDKVVQSQVKGIRALFKSWKISLVQGRGRLISATEVEAAAADGTKNVIASDKLIIATGSRPALISAFPFDGRRVLTSDDALRLESIPESVIIVGAGVIGSEFACILNDLGTDVTIVEMLDRAVATEDEEVSALLQKEFRKRKIKLLTEAKVEKVETTDAGVTATLADGKVLSAPVMLVSIGRALNTEGIGLERAGIKTGPRGQIDVDEAMRTNVDGVYAVGDVTGGILLAHAASRQGIVAAMNACGKEASMKDVVIPAAIFTSPEIGSVGLTERKAVERGMDIRVGRFQYRGLGKAHAMGEIAGLFKIIADAHTDRLLGMHIIGPHASDLVHEGAIAIQNGLTAMDIARTVHAHPTLAEGLMEAAEDAHGMAVHVPAA